MVFGKKEPVEEPPVVPVGWERVRDFVVGNTERPVTAKRKKAAFGPLAVRVPKNGKDYRVFAPCAYVGHVEGDYALYEDADCLRVLCLVDRGGREVGGERHHDVHDGQGQLIGTLRRVPPRSRPFRHTWRIDQPGHPTVVGRNEWASGDAKAFTYRMVDKGLTEVLNAVTSLGAEGGDTPAKPRTLEWRAGDKVVMVSESSKKVTVKADWVDRRLAFAFALVGDR
ncbi:hypothetical protein ACFWBF_00285 [Streptomyces sp. NPDC060028]|uniref:hypothetical protein n=1 Tax=Streptomyces sp. NPDC060028 TaxID=3347041 RepID=UPI003688273E